MLAKPEYFLRQMRFVAGRGTDVQVAGRGTDVQVAGKSVNGKQQTGRR